MRASVSRRSHQTLFGATLIAALILTVSNAQAAVYRGKWDPAFGPALPDLGWRGEATFFVPDACLSLAPGLYSNSDACSSGGMALLNAQVSFYDLSDPLTVLEVLDFDTPSTSLVFAMRVDAQHRLSGVVGAFDYVRISSLPIAAGPDSRFSLIFVDDAARLAFISPNAPYFGVSDLLRQPDGQPNTFITYAQVPEPVTSSGLAGALAAMVALRRRRTATIASDLKNG